MGELRLSFFCPGNSFELNAGSNFKSYLWQDGSVDSIFLIKSPGKYYITTEDFCNNIFTDTIRVYKQDSYFISSPQLPICNNDTALIILPYGYENFNWQPMEWGLKKYNTLQVFPPYSSMFVIKGEHPKGCIRSDTIFISVQKCLKNIYFPNAFTPNNDGVNDLYKPTIFGNLLFYELVIYNRWGQILFKTSDQYNGWNGAFINIPAPIGGYIYKCKYQFFNSSPQFAKGTFVLYR